MARRIFGYVAAAAGTAVALVGVELYASQRVASAAARTAQGDEALKEIRALRAELRGLEQTLGRAVSSCSNVPSAARRLAAPARSAEDPPAVSGAPSASESLRTAFDAEPRDDRWAASARSALAETAKKWGTSGSTLGDVECRSTSCRMTITHRDAASREQFTLAMSQNVSPQTPNVSVVAGADGALLTTTLYMSKPGASP